MSGCYRYEGGQGVGPPREHTRIHWRGWGPRRQRVGGRPRGTGGSFLEWEAKEEIRGRWKEGEEVRERDEGRVGWNGGREGNGGEV